MEILTTFFQYLSERRYTEPDLSDVIFSACNSSDFFFDVFLTYIFDGKYKFMEGFSISREFSSGINGSRIDFKVENYDEDIVCLIENKIDDRVTHYNQYKKAFPNAEIGFIANYEVANKTGHYKYSKTWSGFFKYLDKIKETCDIQERPLIKGIIKYIKGVCGLMDDIGNFNLSQIGSLEDFHTYITSLVQGNSECELNNKKRSIKEFRYGIIFDYRNIELWFGVYTARYSTRLHIGFQSNKNPEISDKIRDKKIAEGDFYREPYEEDFECWFELKDEFHSDLCNDNISVTDKLKIIVDFFNEVLKNILV